MQKTLMTSLHDRIVKEKRRKSLTSEQQTSLKICELLGIATYRYLFDDRITTAQYVLRQLEHFNIIVEVEYSKECFVVTWIPPIGIRIYAFRSSNLMTAITSLVLAVNKKGCLVK